MQKHVLYSSLVACWIFGCGSRVSVGDLGGASTAGATAGADTGGRTSLGGGTSLGEATSLDEGAEAGASPIALPCGSIDYPATAFYGANVLDPSATTFTATTFTATPSAVLVYDFAATLSADASLRVRMTDLDPASPDGGSGGGGPGPRALFGFGNIWLISGDGSDWLVTDFDTTTGVQVLEAHGTQKTLDLQFSFSGKGRALVEYFECDEAAPTRSKTIAWSSSGG